MEWPAQSPDLNPIELVWDELDRRVKAKQPTSATHLWELMQQCWEELSEQYLISIEERMPQVWSADIVAGRGIGREHDREMELQRRLDQSPGIQIVLLRKSPKSTGPFFWTVKGQYFHHVVQGYLPNLQNT